jgi:Icc-related predicted phosphoesterase
MNDRSFFVSDLHGKISRIESLFKEIVRERPGFVFFGGDLLPHGLKKSDRWDDFTDDFFLPAFVELREQLGTDYPEMFIILGNDDYRSEEIKFMEASEQGLFHYLNNSCVNEKEWTVFGYPFVPPTPFGLKDWEKYDVSRYVDPGCIHPTKGHRSADPDYDPSYATIAKDLEAMIEHLDPDKTVFLAHTPPYKTKLDRAALDGMMVEHVPLDVHIGSIAIQRFIETFQPAITLHGHVHESTRITGTWKQRIGKTVAMNAAHDGPELALIQFNLSNPDDAQRILT